MDLHTTTTYEAGATQAAFNRKLQKICDEILLPFGITKTQWLIIGLILDSGSKGIRLNELSEKLGTTMSYLTTAVNLLESRGILARLEDPEDTRSKRIVVVNSYRPTCKKIELTLRDGLRQKIYATVNPTEFSIYMKVMSDLANIE